MTACSRSTAGRSARALPLHMVRPNAPDLRIRPDHAKQRSNQDQVGNGQLGAFNLGHHGGTDNAAQLVGCGIGIV